MVEIIDNKLQQAYDFRDECNAVYSILENLKEQDYEMPHNLKAGHLIMLLGICMCGIMLQIFH